MNPWLSVATAVSIALHCVILYVPFLADLFKITPLTLGEWGLVFAFASPVILIDEALKLCARTYIAATRRAAASAAR